MIGFRFLFTVLASTAAGVAGPKSVTGDLDKMNGVNQLAEKNKQKPTALHIALANDGRAVKLKRRKNMLEKLTKTINKDAPPNESGTEGEEGENLEIESIADKPE
ncbi:MAG: hypothetical protein ACON5H_00175 [Akkermansiaceae bacterium]